MCVCVCIYIHIYIYIYVFKGLTHMRLQVFFLRKLDLGLGFRGLRSLGSEP